MALEPRAPLVSMFGGRTDSPEPSPLFRLFIGGPLVNDWECARWECAWERHVPYPQYVPPR